MDRLRLEQVQNEFTRRGVSVAAWARAHGFSPALVYRVLRGEQPCLRGQCHRIAVALSLKTGSDGNVHALDAWLDASRHKAELRP